MKLIVMCNLEMLIKKRNYGMYTQGLHSSAKKNEFMPFSGKQIDLETITVRNINLMQIDKYQKLSLMYGN